MHNLLWGGGYFCLVLYIGQIYRGELKKLKENCVVKTEYANYFLKRLNIEQTHISVI